MAGERVLYSRGSGSGESLTSNWKGMDMGYDPGAIEPKWQELWREHKAFATLDRPDMPKYYVLDAVDLPEDARARAGLPGGGPGERVPGPGDRAGQ